MDNACGHDPSSEVLGTPSLKPSNLKKQVDDPSTTLNSIPEIKGKDSSIVTLEPYSSRVDLSAQGLKSRKGSRKNTILEEDS